MDKLEEMVVSKAAKAVEIVLNNMLPIPRCPNEKKHVITKREKVRQELANKLGAVGPSQLK